MIRLAAVLTLFLIHGSVAAKGVDFVRPILSIERAPVTSDTLGRLFGKPAFVQLHRPVAVGAYGNIVYLFDAGPNLFYRYDREQETLQGFPRISSALKGVPTGIAVDEDLTFYVSDPAGHQVIHGSLDGQVLQTFKDDAKLSNPVAAVFDSARAQLLVADSLIDHIAAFNQLGWFLFAFGQRGKEAHQFQLIVDMAPGPQGLYLVDRLNPFIKIYSLEGKFINSFQRSEVSNPSAIAVDWRGRVYVADSFDDTIKVYVEEKFVGEIGGIGSALGRFRFITDIYVDQGYLYVADSMNGRFQIFVIDGVGPNRSRPKYKTLPLPMHAPGIYGTPLK